MSAVAASISLARPAACSSRAGSSRRAAPAAPAAATPRQPTAVHAVAGARPSAEPEAPEAASTRPQPHVEVFPAMIASRLTEDNRMFVEAHRCGAARRNLAPQLVGYASALRLRCAKLPWPVQPRQASGSSQAAKQPPYGAAGFSARLPAVSCWANQTQLLLCCLFPFPAALQDSWQRGGP